METVDVFAVLADAFISTVSAPGKPRACIARCFRVTRADSDGSNRSESFTESFLMRAVVQRVSDGKVVVDGVVRGRIADGLLVYLGVGRGDGEADTRYLAEKIRHLRVFPDEAKHMNLDVKQVGGRVLVISAFSVQADARKGRRPSFDNAEQPDRAAVLYEMFCDELIGLGVTIEKGVFGAMMDVVSTNAGPVCVLLESRRAF